MPPGLWLDEAVDGLQARALWKGERLPATADWPFPRWAVWNRVEAVSIAALGPTSVGVRAPAVLVGILCVWMASAAASRVAGAGAGLAAAAFLAGSTWHALFSRTGLPCIGAVAEGLVAGWLLLGAGPVSWRHGVALGGLCAVAWAGYSASLVTPLVVGWLLACRLAGRRWTRGQVAAVAATVAVAVVAGVAVAGLNPTSLRRATSLSVRPPGEFLSQLGLCLRHLVLPVPPGWGVWQGFPAGAARMRPHETALVVAGLFALRGLPPRVGIALAGWLGLSLLPEAVPGGAPNLLRGLPQLAPLAVLAGLGADAIVARFGRRAALAVAGVLLLGGVQTADRLYREMARSPVAAAWYVRVDAEAAAWIREAGGAEPVALTPDPVYPSAPTVRFHLLREFESGRVIGTMTELDRPRLEKVFRDPMAGQPLLFGFRAARRLDGHPHLGLINIDGLLSRGRGALAVGRPAEAEREARAVLALADDSAAAHRLLGAALMAGGRRREALPHLRFALGYAPGDAELARWLIPSLSPRSPASRP